MINNLQKINLVRIKLKEFIKINIKLIPKRKFLKLIKSHQENFNLKINS